MAATTKECNVGKLEVIAVQKASILAAQDAALEAGLGAVYDGAVAEVGQPGAIGFTQADIDAAVAKTQADDAAALAAAHAEADAKLAELQTAFDTLNAKEVTEEADLANATTALAAMQGTLDAIKQLLSK
jgi:hypothetical protein